MAHYCLMLASDTSPQHADKVAGARRGLDSLPTAVMYDQAEMLLLAQIDGVWTHGWQPSELHRQARRGSTPPAARLLDLAIATDHANRRSVTLDRRWVAQVEDLDLPAVNGRPGFIGRWAAAEALAAGEATDAIVDALTNVLGLSPLDLLLPPPGADRSAPDPTWSAATGGPAGGESDPVLERIRALLAKAESSAFEAEATAFTAKAQELMTRHAIDAAIVAGRGDAGAEDPVLIRVPVDPPYVDAKSLLLQTVAQASRCKGVFHPTAALSTVVGFPADVAAVEVLFTSLLLPAQPAMADAAKHAPAGARTRSQSYRSAFLLAYANRIGDRLEEINDAVYADVEAEQGSAFLPVLRSRADLVDGVVQDRFGDLESSRVRGGYDPAGWAGGELAADSAELNAGEVDEDKDAPELSAAPPRP
jgi:hypothetical protein